MSTRRIAKLEPVAVRDIWPHEEYDFTPWLAEPENLEQLGQTLDMNLELVDREVNLPGAGRVDILARDADNETPVVIENQLTGSDDGHFLRLLGYAANSDARTLVWLATSFTDWHRSILDWLNQADGIDVYGVEVSGWRVGEYFAPQFRLEVAPPNPRCRPVVEDRRSGNRAFGHYYRPLTSRLRTEGIVAMGGRHGGFTGSYRSFRTGYEDQRIYYALQIGDNEGKSWVWLLLNNSDIQRTVYDTLYEDREQIAAEMANVELEWETAEDGSFSWVGASTDASLNASEEELEQTRAWMFDNLVQLRNAIQPRLNRVVAELPVVADHIDSLNNGAAAADAGGV